MFNTKQNYFLDPYVTNMNVSEFNAPFPVEQILKEKYILSAGLSVREFSVLTGIPHGYLTGVLNGSHRMSMRIINKVCAVTNTTPRYWLELRLKYELWEFQLTRDFQMPISPIVKMDCKVQTIPGSPGSVLYNNFIKPLDLSLRSLSLKSRISKPMLQKMIAGKNSFSYSKCIRLSKALNTRSTYWFILQLKYDLSILLKDEGRFPKYVLSELKNCYNKLDDLDLECNEGTEVEQPGIVFKKLLLSQSNITMRDWNNLFCASEDTFNAIFKGTIDLPIKIIVKARLIFDTSIEFWINKIVLYGMRKGKRPGSSTGQAADVDPVLTPGHILINHLLPEANWSVEAFAKHIGVTSTRLYDLRSGKLPLDFDLALRLGQALEKDPMYWIGLQINHDIATNRKKRIWGGRKSIEPKSRSLEVYC